MKRSKEVIVIVSLFFLTLVLGMGHPGTAGAQKAIVMRIGHSMPVTHGYQIWAEEFKKELAKLVKDRVDVQIFPNAQLGKETEYLEGMRMGTLDGSVLGRHNQIDGRLDAINLPMIFRDDKHTDIVLRQNSKLQEELDSILYERGYKNLGWGELGFRFITTKDRAIRKAGDLKGVGIRVPPIPPWTIAFRAWGANPTPLDFTELYSALQQGVVNAQENPPEIIYNSKFYEVQKFLSLTGHANVPCQFLLGKVYWERLPKDIQDAVTKAGTISRDVQVKHVRQANEKLVGDLEKLGMVVIRDVDKASFIPGAEEAYKQFEDKIGKELIRKIREAK
jgi:TRAP-type transport system periplasmic protein